MYWFVYMWVQSSVWLFTMKEYNKTPLIRSPSNFTIRRAMKLDLESYFDVSKLDVWLNELEFWFEVEGHWLDLELNWRKISTLIWRSRNEPCFWGSKNALLDLEMILYFGISFNKNFPYRSFLLTLPYSFLHLMLPRGLISFANHPRHRLEINLITNILSWTIERLWIHHKILMSADPLKRQSKEVIEKYKTDFGRQCFQNRGKTNKI